MKHYQIHVIAITAIALETIWLHRDERGTLRAMSVDSTDSRTHVLLLMPRSHRPEYESKIEMIAHTQTAHSTYLRPREGKDAIRESGMES